jgi:hypothetical protein
MFFQVADLLLERGDNLLELGGVIREAVNIQKHARRIAEAEIDGNTFLLVFYYPVKEKCSAS